MPTAKVKEKVRRRSRGRGWGCPRWRKPPGGQPQRSPQPWPRRRTWRHLVDVGKDGVNAGQRRVLGFGTSRAGRGVETRARVAPIAQGGPNPAVRQTEKPVERQIGNLKGGIGAGRGERGSGANDRGARDTTLPMVRDPIRAERDADVVSRTHGDGDGGRLLGELNTLHTRLGHDLHGAGLGGGAGGAAAGAARTAETRETWATAIFLGCVLVCTRMGSARWAARLDSDLVRTRWSARISKIERSDWSRRDCVFSSPAA